MCAIRLSGGLGGKMSSGGRLSIDGGRGAIDCDNN